MARKSKSKSGEKPTPKRKRRTAARPDRAAPKNAKSTAKGRSARQSAPGLRRPQRSRNPSVIHLSRPRRVRSVRRRRRKSRRPLHRKLHKKNNRAEIAAAVNTRKYSTGRGKPYFITTAIAYPNGPPHIGHAYEAIATDAIARFTRLDGFDVFFLTGTDEHGIKMLQTAAKEGVSTERAR